MINAWKMLHCVFLSSEWLSQWDTRGYKISISRSLKKKKEEELPTLQQFFLTSKEGQTFSSRDRKF